MMKIAKEKKFKREYIPIIGLVLFLLLLIAILVIVFLWEKKDWNINVPEDEYIANEILVDTSDSLCDEATVSKLYNDFSQVEFKWEPVEYKFKNGADQYTGEEVDVTTYVFEVTFDKITEDMYIIIENDNRRTDKESVKLTYEDAKDGKITYQTEPTDLVITYTVSIYASKYDCKDELFRKFTFQTPIYNKWNAIDICASYPDFEYCQKFITAHTPSDDMFFTKLYEYGQKNNIKITKFIDTLEYDTDDFYKYLPESSKTVYDSYQTTTTTKKVSITTTKKAGN